jgi:hypothetical protein
MQTEKERKIVSAVVAILTKQKVAHRLDSVGRNKDGVAVWCDPDDLEKVEAAFLKSGAAERSIECREGEDDSDTWMTVVAYDSAAVAAKLEKDLVKALLGIRK